MADASDERPYLSIKQVLARLQPEFPELTISKIRFLESQGLIEPRRTAAGYRTFADDDVERLEFVLREQREHHLPLRIIRDRLDGSVGPTAGPTPTAAPVVDPAVGAVSDRQPAWLADRERRRARAVVIGAPTPRSDPDPAPAPAPAVPVPAAPASGNERLRSQASHDRAALLAASGLDDATLTTLEQAGLVTGRTMGRERVYDDDDLLIATCVADLARHGVEARHLRAARAAAEREAGLIEQVVLPFVKQRNPEAQRQARTTAGELVALGGSLHVALVRRALRDLLGIR